MVRAVRVLVVDDEPTTADSLGWLLSAAGCEVRVCHSGERALAEAGEFRPDAAFVDLVMRGISGVAVAAGLRALADPPRLLVCLTGATDERVIPLVRAAGFDVHLLKPTDPRDLVLLARTAAPSGDAGGRVG
jgi:DNA-binding response OmpR family regulator